MSSEDFQSLLDALPCGIAHYEIVTDTNGKAIDFRLLAVNKAFVSLLAPVNDRLAGKTLCEICSAHSMELPEWFQLLLKVTTQEDSCGMEYYSNATRKWYAVEVSKSEPGLVSSLFTDITTYKFEEDKQIRLSETTLDVTMKSIPDIVIRTTVEGIINYINEPSILKMLGISESSVLGKSIFSFVSPSDMERIQRNAVLMFEKALGVIEYTLLLAEGVELVCQVNGDVIRDVDNQPIGLVFVIRDISDLKKLEKDLTREAELRELLMAVSAGFINIPIDQVDEEIHAALRSLAEFVNADRAYIFEYDWEHAVCNNTFEWCAEGISSEMHNLQNLPISVMGVTPKRHLDGESEYIPDVSAIPEDDARGILEEQGIKSMITVPMMNKQYCIGFVGFDSVNHYHLYTETDIQLLKLFGQLLANIHLRKDIINQLVSAKVKAEESDSLKTSFIHNISHEIRTPLNGILGFAHLLALHNVQDHERTILYDNLNQSCSRLLNTINDYMDMALIVSRTMTLRKTPVDVVQLVDAVSDEAYRLCSAKKLHFETKINLGDAGTTIISDKDFLQKILIKLIDNAVKFTEKGFVTLECRLQTDRLDCKISDSGCGIETDKFDSIFEMFLQADNSLARGYEGSGLGLTIAKGLVSLLGGHIQVDSVIGLGSAFSFSIPVSITDDPEPENLLLHSSGVKAPRKPLVLIAEDDDLNFKYMMAVLSAEGFDYLYAENGKLAVDYCRKNPAISLVLMDVKMPVMNGEEAAVEIHQFRPDLPIVATTAYVRNGDRQRFLAAGFVEFLAKPVSRENILALINRFCGSSTETDTL